jgi:hypothetical protein
MITSVASLSTMSQTIQLALAPAFLLAGIAGILNVMTGRLARIVDRGRRMTEESIRVEPSMQGFYGIERDNLENRRYLASAAITACSLSALLVCLVIVVLFLEALLGLKIRWVIGILFSSSTLALVVGLTYFLREVHLAMRTVRFILPRND